MDKVPWGKVWRVLRVVLSFVLLGLAVYFLADRVPEIQHAWGLVHKAQPRWLAAAVLFEVASMIVFARIQRGLLRAGGVHLPIGTMVEITVAGNAVAATIPGGVAWAAAWVFGQLKLRGVDRFLRVWVFLVAGAVSSFALFVVVAGGIWLAGNRGPVSGLRWGALVLAMIPVAALLLFPARSTRPFRRVEIRIRGLLKSVPGGRWVTRVTRTFFRRIEAVHLSPAGWVEVFAFGLLNWLYDCAVLIMSMLAIGVPVPWRGIFVIYGITQIAAAFPITPGGLGVVEGSLAALLHAYGVSTKGAIATVIVYRFISFWGLVPIGWGLWVVLDLMQRKGLRQATPHPWAVHRHTKVGPDVGRQARLLLPQPKDCDGCGEGAQTHPHENGEEESAGASEESEPRTTSSLTRSEAR